METLSEVIRKTTTFLLAVFVWLHALFLLNFGSGIVAKGAYYLRLTTSETIVLALLVIFSFASGSGFWKPVSSVLYIYAFPFVLFWKALYCLFRAIRSLHRWFKKHSYTEAKSETEKVTPPITIDKPEKATPRDKQAKAFVKFLARPFYRFVWLWCILLLIATHIEIIWVCLAVVAIHLLRKIFLVLEVMFFFDPYLERAIDSILATVEKAVNAVSIFNPEAEPSDELKNTCTQIKGWKLILGLLKNNYLVSRWAWVLSVASFVLIYVYFAALFSFVYLGMAKVGHVGLSWGNALVSSLFIPLFAADLPRTIAFRLVAGIQVVLVLAVGFGTFYSFLQRRLNMVLKAAAMVNGKLVDRVFEERLSALDKVVADRPATPVLGQKTLPGLS